MVTRKEKERKGRKEGGEEGVGVGVAGACRSSRRRLRRSPWPAQPPHPVRPLSLRTPSLPSSQLWASSTTAQRARPRLPSSRSTSSSLVRLRLVAAGPGAMGLSRAGSSDETTLRSEASASSTRSSLTPLYYAPLLRVRRSTALVGSPGQGEGASSDLAAHRPVQQPSLTADANPSPCLSVQPRPLPRGDVALLLGAHGRRPVHRPLGPRRRMVRRSFPLRPRRLELEGQRPLDRAADACALPSPLAAAATPQGHLHHRLVDPRRRRARAPDPDQEPHFVRPPLLSSRTAGASQRPERRDRRG